MSRRNIIDSDSDDDDASSTTSPRRRSLRIRRKNTDSSDAESDSDSDIMDSSAHSNRNNNRNNNRNRSNAQQSEFEFDEDSSDDNNDDNKDQTQVNDEPLDIGHPKYSLILPTAISKLGDFYEKIDKDIENVVLPGLIDAAQGLAEYNHQQPDFSEQSEKLNNILHQILDSSKEFKITKLMLNRVVKDIRDNDALDDNKEDDNPTQSGDWMGYLDSKRDALYTEIDSGPVLDNDGARIKNRINSNKKNYEEQFKDAIQLDEIEDPDNNHNNRNDGSDDDDDDLDIVVDKSAKNTGSIKCPLTFKVFKKPYKSKVCGHTFEKEAILRYIKSRVDVGELVSCPLPGCEKVLNADGFIRDVRVEKLVKAQRKQEEEEESEEDDEGMDFTVPDI